MQHFCFLFFHSCSLPSRERHSLLLTSLRNPLTRQQGTSVTVTIDGKEYGGYYAWGETEEKENYCWNTYKWCNDSLSTLTKYCTDDSYGIIVDNKTILDPEDDVAHVKWGGSWRMPTIDEYKELIYNCS